jgi:hypothetical protein
MTAAPTVLDLDRGHPERTRLLLALMPALGVVGLTFGIALGLDTDDLVVMALALVTAALAFLPLVLDQARPPSQRHILLSTFSVLFVIGFVVPVFVIFLPEGWPVDAPSYSFSELYPQDLIRGQLATILALVSLYVGYALPLQAVSAPLPRFERDWSLGATLAVACLILPFGWAVLLASLFGEFSEAWGSGVLSVLASSYTYGIALLAIATLRYRSRLALVLLAIVVPVTSAFGLFTGSKGAILIAGAMVFLAVVVVRRRIALRWILLGLLASALIYPVGMFIRNDILVGNTLTARDVLQRPTQTLERISDFLASSRPGEYLADGLSATAGRFDNLGAASVIIRDTPRVSPFQYGRTLALFFIYFIPRAVWPEKPIITLGRFITDVYGSGPQIESNTAPTPIGDFFLNFGYPGVIGGMLLWGIMVRIGHEVLMRGRPTTPALFVAVVLLRELGLNFQGNVANIWAVTVTAIVPIIAAHLAVRTLSRPAEAPHKDHFPPRVDAEART